MNCILMMSEMDTCLIFQKIFLKIQKHYFIKTCSTNQTNLKLLNNIMLKQKQIAYECDWTMLTSRCR